MKAPSSQARSWITSVTAFPPIRAWVKSGYMVGEWLPQMANRSTCSTPTPAFSDNLALARFSSNRVMANQRSCGRDFPDCMAIHALVLHGLPTTSTRASFEATSARACPCSTKIFPFRPRRSERSMPGFRGILPTQRVQSAPSKARFGSVVATTSSNKGKAPSLSSITTPCRALSACGTSNNWSLTFCSGPKSPPEAIRKTKA